MLTVQAPTKLNLTLEVLCKRPDSYHEIRSVIQTISLCDVLRFQLSQRLVIESDMVDWNAEESLVSRAASLLQKATGCTEGATIKVEKHIPLVSGLGGDSSDAAATLLGLNRLWELGLMQKKLLKMAAQLGSDVSFFLYGGTALAEGRGELITPLPPLPRMWAVLVVPPMPRLPGKTAQLYASLKDSHYTDGQITEKLVQALKEGLEFSTQLLFNTFENVAFMRLSELRVYRDHIMKLGADNVHLAGSGPTLFTLVREGVQAEVICTRCKEQGMEAYLVETS